MTAVRRLDPPPQQLPPSAEEVERAVLGILLQYPASWNTVAEILRPDMFYLRKHHLIYEAGLRLFHGGHPVDPITVAVALRNAAVLDECDGPVYLSQVATAITGSTNAEYYARIVVEKFMARELIKIGSKMVSDGYEDRDAFDMLDTASAKLTDLYAVTQPTVLGSAADEAGEMMDKKEENYLTFGIPPLDEIAVLEAGLPVVIAGRPGIGKSIFCVEVCWHLTLAGNVLLFSPEMTKKQVTSRILARESGVPYSVILHRRMDEQQLEIVKQTWLRIGNRMERLKVDPQSGITPKQIRVRAERAMKSHNVIAMAVDHLHKMRTGDPSVDRDDFKRITQCMNGITEVAKNTALPALVMCQLNREVEKRSNKRPTMADLRGSGAIEEDAAVVGLLYREGYYQAEPPWEDQLEIHVGKNRDGGTREVHYGITPALSLIGPVSQANIKRVKDEAPIF